MQMALKDRANGYIAPDPSKEGPLHALVESNSRTCHLSGP
jgi:hypothetical protein